MEFQHQSITGFRTARNLRVNDHAEDRLEGSVRRQADYSCEEQMKEEAQRYFLKMVREVCPEVLVDLRDTVFPRYQAWIKKAQRKYHSQLASIAHPVFRSYALLQQDTPELAAVVADWGNRFHLEGELATEPEWHGAQWHEYARRGSHWPWQKALEALYAWQWLRDGSQLRNSDPPQWPALSTLECGAGDQFTLHLVVPGYIADRPPTESAYVQQILAQAKVILREYVARQKHLARANGQKRTARKYAPEHFTWLAQRQVWGWSDREIADWHRSRMSVVVTADAVRHGLGLAAELIQLKLRPLKRGRPRSEK
jgi:hypothetical protein